MDAQSLRMHAVPIHARTIVQITVRTGTATNSPAAIAT